MNAAEQPNPNPSDILKTGLGFWASKTLLSAVELGVFTELARGPQTLEELQKKLDLHDRSARDFLDALVALGFCSRDGDSTYQNTVSTDFFLDSQKPSYIGGLLEMANDRLYPFWADLTEALKTGKPQNETKNGGQNIFDMVYADPERLQQFLSFMTAMSSGSNMAIAQKFPWDRYQSFVDVGTAQGGFAAAIGKAHPHLNGIGFDLPPVQPIFEEFIDGHDLTNQMRFEAGDFFKQALPKADVVVMGHVLHDWNLEEKQHLIDSAYNALPEGGALIVYETIIDDDRTKNAFGLLMSLNMLIETPGGFDYTAADCQSWMRKAGFRETSTAPLAGPESMVVAIK